ncbi:MAG: cytochrome c oxidase assembly protein [Propionibacteriaceae bacterium]
MSQPAPLAQLGLLVAVVVVLGYLRCVRRNRVGPWPRRRTASWVLGWAIAYVSALALLPGHPMRPRVHMLGHLGLAMLAPVLLVVAAPLTLVLRSLPVPRARRLVTWLHRAPVRWLVHPVVAAVLDVGGLWLLYTTPLLAWAHASALLSVVVIMHLGTAGFLFTAAMISVDPLPRRPSYARRAVVLVLAAAAHGILAKHLYAVASDPAGRRAAMIMYYGGDLVEVVLVIVLGLGWWRRTGHTVRPPAVTDWADVPRRR